VRRTSTIDTSSPEGLLADAVVDARARDLVTAADGTAHVVGRAHVEARVARVSHELLEITSDPEVPALARLVGTTVGPGFRARAVTIGGDEHARRTPLNLLLDDLPGASLVSGYALLRGDLQGPSADSGAPEGARRYLEAKSDMCAGWASDATIMVTIRARGVSPTPLGPPAPTIERGDDAEAWHRMEALTPLAMRRRRRVDVTAPAAAGAPVEVEAFFRDSHVDDEGVETVVHEYTVTATVDPISMTVLDASAALGVLPWMECPGALASAGRVAGMAVTELRRDIRETFVGTSTCTHLNDTLRGLEDVAALIEHLPGHVGLVASRR